MNIRNTVSQYVFTRNPIIIEKDYGPGAFAPKGGTMVIKIGGVPIYRARFDAPLSMDISEIVDAHTPYFPDLSPGSSQPLTTVCNDIDLDYSAVRVETSYAGIDDYLVFTPIPGGVSNQNCRRLAKRHIDAFAARFAVSSANCLLTTRTQSWRIIIKETELAPLYFLKSRATGGVAVIDPASRKKISLGNVGIGIHAINIDAIRRCFVADHSILPSILDIYICESFSCRIVIEQSQCTSERYRIKFRNALGVFEIVEIIGEMSLNSEYAQDSTFSTYDSLTGRFSTQRDRLPRTQTFIINSEPMRQREIRFIMDMISSDEIYILDIADYPVRVIPSADSLKYRTRTQTPDTITVSFTLADTETNIMDDIIAANEAHRPRVFESQFTDTFN